MDLDRIKKIAGTNKDYLLKLLPNARIKGNEVVCGNIYGDKGSSFSYNLLNGLWSDFATGQSGGSIIDLIMARENVDFMNAVRIINNEFHIEDIATTEYVLTKKGTNKPKHVPAPKGSRPEYLSRGPVTVRLNQVWVYNNEHGFPIQCDCRINNKDGTKEVIPMLYDGEKWYPKALSNNRKLYNLDKILDEKTISKTVIISEGCKTADAISVYFPNYVSTTWQGGCNAFKKTDWSPLYGRKIIIVPDADDCGLKAAENIAAILTAKNCSVRLVNMDAMQRIKKGWDFADALDGNMLQKDVVDYIKQHIYNFNAPVVDEEINTEIIVDKKIDKPTYDDTYFKCLGVQGDHHFYYKKNTSQIIEFKPNFYDSKHLLNLAPLNWWQISFPRGKKDVDWVDVTDYLCRIQEKTGIFDITKVRGRGAWFDEGRTVFHLGNYLFVDGSIVAIDDFKSEFFYEKAPALAVKIQSKLPVDDAFEFVELCRMPRWERPCYGDILAGWIFSALVCGAMRFRSHLYLIGAHGSGKSWVLENIVQRIMGNIALYVASKSTEAGIREQLSGDIRPVVFDEAEAENPTDKQRMQAIIDLARSASSEKAESIVKFGSKYVCRSSFLFSSINSSMSKNADLSRTAFIKMKKAPLHTNKEQQLQDNIKFKELECKASKLLTDEYVRCLLGRAIALVPTIRESHKIIADLSAKEFGSRRLGDQMAMILAGLWGLQSDEVITEQDAINLIHYTNLQNNSSADEQSQEELCLDTLLFSQIEIPSKIGNKKLPLNQIVSIANRTDFFDGISFEDAKKFLAARGVAIGNVNGKPHLLVAVNKNCLANICFEKTEWSSGWKDALLRIENVLRTDKNKYFSNTLISRAIAIPLELVIKKFNPNTSEVI